jgi:hypothetical protein
MGAIDPGDGGCRQTKVEMIGHRIRVARLRLPGYGLADHKESSGGRTVIRPTLIKAADTPIRRHTKIKAAANPFDPDWEPYFEARETAAMKKFLIGRVKTLWEKQDGKCPTCN